MQPWGVRSLVFCNGSGIFWYVSVTAQSTDVMDVPNLYRIPKAFRPGMPTLCRSGETVEGSSCKLVGLGEFPSPS